MAQGQKNHSHSRQQRRGPLLTNPFSTVALSLLLLLLTSPASAADEYDYYSWQSDNFHNGRFYTKEPQCVDIPADLRLCHNVGYKKMRLPNLLDHETMPEVKQQAGSWVPLLAKRCHADTQVFLCSLFAPVCLDRPIYPCRSLCEAVRDSCAPVMETYGFPWPEMLTCDKFPIDNDLCIPIQFAGNQATPAPVLSHRCNSCTDSGEAKVESQASSKTQPNQAAPLLDTMEASRTIVSEETPYTWRPCQRALRPAHYRSR
ncbi:secreted frizzled-related protein 5-like isoform 2-T2 [Salvelinus alpinus]